ncbi:MAG: hypothetical protein ACRDHX_00030 [Chloroflexota bacterium]
MAPRAIVTLNKTNLAVALGMPPPPLLAAVDAGLRLALSLS